MLITSWIPDVNPRKLLFMFLFTTFFISGCNDTEQQYELVSVTGGLGVSNREMNKDILGFDLFRKVSLGNWQCYVPDKHPNAMFFCTHGSRIVMQAIGKGLDNVYISTTSDQLNFVILNDRDRDGDFDSLSYDGTDENGNLKRQIYDYNLDGIPDKLIDFDTKSSKVRFDDEWVVVRSSKRDSSGKVIYEITIDGVQKRIYPHSYPYKIEELESNKALQTTSKGGD